ncbi:hypothetical protein RFI_32078 [Reticulomyxa filosa]|uniref:Uncharacterized protein n=1 Tax=Reticulomyxa filosa TaxID=46433 RepID=X6LVD0_RETFI|nr:hypothetical protein RFI_32078 [Reticulomyxa filosa]|eukprot:ETO05321.1 hypothetical protein RFI_32078 [Reticulomyxa filosa]
MKYHKSSPAIMKEMARLLKNMAKASPEFSDKIAECGILDECLDILKNHPNECGAYALDIIDSCLKHSSNPKKVADALLKKGALDVLQNCLSKNISNSELAGSLVQTLNLLAQIQPDIARAIGEKKIYRNVLDAMKMHPENPKLAVNGCELLAVSILFISFYFIVLFYLLEMNQILRTYTYYLQ